MAAPTQTTTTDPPTAVILAGILDATLDDLCADIVSHTGQAISGVGQLSCNHHLHPAAYKIAAARLNLATGTDEVHHEAAAVADWVIQALAEYLTNNRNQPAADTATGTVDRWLRGRDITAARDLLAAASNWMWRRPKA